MKHPYESAPDSRRWSRVAAGREAHEIDPVEGIASRIRPDDQVVSAGSCFAQHVTRYLESRGQRCLKTETAHPLMDEGDAREFGYGIYAARYGNIYTTRQLLQLWQRATGQFVPEEDFWEQEGVFHDPFRPIVQPGGFPTLQELEADRRRHFAAVVEAFTRMDVMIFTMGLTECWTSAADGAVYPLCPGVACGRFDAARHTMVNLSADEVAADMETFVHQLREVNPDVRLIVTVSPQPQTATAEERHVVVEAGFSKAKLRVAAERICQMPNVDYFPSYEIVSIPGSRYFEDDRRSVREEGIARVMELFFEHVIEGEPDEEAPVVAEDTFLADGKRLIRALCDEELLDPDSTGPEPSPHAAPIPTASAPAIREIDTQKMHARSLAIAGRVAEALDLAEELYRQEPRAGLAFLIELWKSELQGERA